MIYLTSSKIIGKKITRSLGLVRGNTVRARNIGRDILAVLKNIIGGEIEDYTKLLAESRQQAIDRMIEEAKALGANGIVDMRFATSMVTNMAAEIIAYGTAVYVEDE